MLTNMKREFLYNDTNKILPIHLLKTSYGATSLNPNLSVVADVDTSTLNISVGFETAIGYLINIEDDIIVESVPVGSDGVINFKKIERNKTYWVYIVSKDYEDGYITPSALKVDAQRSQRTVYRYREGGESQNIVAILEISANETDPSQWYNYAGSYLGDLIFFPTAEDGVTPIDYSPVLAAISSELGAVGNQVSAVSTLVGTIPGAVYADGSETRGLIDGQAGAILNAISNIQCGGTGTGGTGVIIPPATNYPLFATIDKPSSNLDNNGGTVTLTNIAVGNPGNATLNHNWSVTQIGGATWFLPTITSNGNSVNVSFVPNTSTETKQFQIALNVTGSDNNLDPPVDTFTPANTTATITVAGTEEEVGPTPAPTANIGTEDSVYYISPGQTSNVVVKAIMNDITNVASYSFSSPGAIVGNTNGFIVGTVPNERTFTYPPIAEPNKTITLVARNSGETPVEISGSTPVFSIVNYDASDPAVTSISPSTTNIEVGQPVVFTPSVQLGNVNGTPSNLKKQEWYINGVYAVGSRISNITPTASDWSHTFTEPGTYRVKLYVEDIYHTLENNNSGSYEISVTVTEKNYGHAAIVITKMDGVDIEGKMQGLISNISGLRNYDPSFSALDQSILRIEWKTYGDQNVPIASSTITPIHPYFEEQRRGSSNGKTWVEYKINKGTGSPGIGVNGSITFSDGTTYTDTVIETSTGWIGGQCWFPVEGIGGPPIDQPDDPDPDPDLPTVDEFEVVEVFKFSRRMLPSVALEDFGTTTVKKTIYDLDTVAELNSNSNFTSQYRLTRAPVDPYDNYTWHMIKYKNEDNRPISEYPTNGPNGTIKMIRVYLVLAEGSSEFRPHTMYRYMPFDEVVDGQEVNVEYTLILGGVSVGKATKPYRVQIDNSIDAMPYYGFRLNSSSNYKDQKMAYLARQDTAPNSDWTVYGEFFTYQHMLERRLAVIPGDHLYTMAFGQGSFEPWRGVLPTIPIEGGAGAAGLGGFNMIPEGLPPEGEYIGPDGNINGVANPFGGAKAAQNNAVLYQNVQQTGQLAILQNIRFLKNLIQSIDDNMWATVNNTNRVIMDSILEIKEGITKKTASIFNIVSANANNVGLSVKYRSTTNSNWQPMAATVDSEADIININLGEVEDFNNVGKYLIKVDTQRIQAIVDRVDNGIVFIKDDLLGYGKNYFHSWNIQFMDENYNPRGEPRLIVASEKVGSTQRLQVSPVVDGLVNSGDRIAIWSNAFIPTVVEVDIVEHNNQTLSYSLYAKKELNTNTGLCTLYDHNGNVYKQFTYGKILDRETGFDLIEYRDPIDG